MLHFRSIDKLLLDYSRYNVLKIKLELVLLQNTESKSYFDKVDSFISKQSIKLTVTLQNVFVYKQKNNLLISFRKQYIFDNISNV